MLDATPFAWRAAKLGSVAEITTGGTPPRAVREFWGGVLPWVTTAEVDFGTILSTAEQITRAGLSNSSARMYPVGTLLVALYGQGRTRGRVARLGIAASCNQACAALQVNEEVSGDYLFHWLSGQYETLRALSNSGGQENLSLTILREVEVAIPPLEEQRAIAAALNDVDALIAALDALIAKKRDIKQATMQQLLTGKTRLPGFSGAWELKRLGDIFSFKNGLNKGKEFFGDGSPIVNYMDVYGSSRISAACLVGRVRVSGDELKAYEVRRGDVFFTRTSETVNEIGIAATVLDDCVDTVFSGFILRARQKGASLSTCFSAYCFQADGIRDQIKRGASYTTRALTNGRQLSNVTLPLPPLAEQRAIAEVLTDLDAELAALDARREKTRLIKQGMMQALLTGQVRLV
ncbi:restriction endonuclease subunit S [Myxococcota bacterium]|nr:restriction endonuclease subunit S [Myxococcota bacterium]